MINMGADTIAVGFYLGVLLMATTVVVLTIIFMTKPKPDKPFAKPATKPLGEKEVETGEGVQTPVQPDTAQPLSPDLSHIQPEQIDAILQTARSRNMISGMIKKVKSRFKLRISFPVKRVKNLAELPPLPAETAAVEDTPPSAEKNQVAASVRGSPVKEDPLKILEVSIPKVEVNNVPAATNPKAEVSDVSSTAEPIAEVNNVPPAAIPETNSSTPAAKEPEMKKENKPEVKTENKNVIEPPKSDAKPPQSEPEPGKPAAAEAGNTPAETQQKERKTSGSDLSELFTSEIAETSEASKLAEYMDQVDVNNLLKEGKDLLNMIKKNRS